MTNAAIGKRVERSLPLPPPPASSPQESTEGEPVSNRITLTIASGDTLSGIFRKAGLRQRDLLELLDIDTFRTHSRNLRPGQELEFILDAGGRLRELAFRVAPEHTIRLLDDGERFRAKEEITEYERRQRFASGTIDQSLFLSGREAGLSDGLLMHLIGIFGWDIDFVMDIRRGDSFTVLYEELWHNGQKVRDGAILAAEFVSQGRTHRAIRHAEGDGRSNYYTPEGMNMRKTFIRTPVEFRRISSGFGNRYHPTLNRMRRHNGVDYASPTGTPIRATGEGRIVHLGTKGGYGKTIVVRHGGRYSTLYAHMSRYAPGLRAGRSVRQGQIIGYVGQTGLATGPHLHYEFRVNGVHRNPLTVNFPRSQPLADDALPAFREKARPLLARLELFQRTRLASSTPVSIATRP
ncbi:MAG: M23 family metallopeptidase [Pseudomonadota bacterium]